MILGRKYIPANKMIEVSKDPNLHFSKKSIEHTMTKTDDSKQAEFSFNKPKIEKFSKEAKMIKYNVDVSDSNLPMKTETILDIAPDSEDFVRMERIVTKKFGEKVRLSAITMIEPNLQEYMDMKIQMPDRNPDGSVKHDQNGNIIMKPVKISELAGNSQKEYEMLNALNNTTQQLGAAQFNILNAVFSNNYFALSAIEKDETYNTLIKLDLANVLDNNDNLPFLVDSFYINDSDDLYANIKSRIYITLRKRGLNSLEAHNILGNPQNFYLGKNYEVWTVANFIQRMVAAMLNDYVGIAIGNTLPRSHEQDLIYMINLLSVIPNGRIQWEQVNADIINPNHDEISTFYFRLAFKFYNDLSNDQNRLYSLVYRGRADDFLQDYTNLTAAERYSLINSAENNTIANGFDLAQNLRFHVENFAFVRDIPLNLPAHRIRINS